MNTQTILAEKTVSASDVRKHPCQYFEAEPVAVLSHNKTAGYMVGAELFEAMVRQLEACNPKVESLFRPTAARLKAISADAEKLLAEAKKSDLDDFAVQK
ncbi:type I toxin-antitoxin system antitoxin YafN [Idiomarina sp. UBA4520]|jgi:antitoxin YafN|uniref:type I toxin-antitoxin system antitoxin YafN n=1 Tax=Idiomarina sp. UBA4520 TaxID=1946647 RepID=UPI000A3E3E1A|nr:MULTISPECIES: type I toxin-antitoxin system antitoxin YafN [unclassified Idiomarina]MBF39109.1 antitoxin of toxin-antitoxin stability system [Idiomarinaceae bacterium]|tara:strand:+ start:18151 stop:18450 length:300 start_codon:yes stop_codon:yes gene_type:complete